MDEPRSSVNPLRGRAPYDEEVSLARYAEELWQHRLILFAVAVLSVAIAWAIDWNRAPVFQASSRLMVSASKISDATSPVSMGTYQMMVSSQSLVSATLADLGLSNPPRSLSPASMGRNLTVQTIPDTYVIQLTARLDDPTLAAEFANRLADKSVDLARQTSREDTIAARDTIKLQLDESRARLVEAEHELEVFQRKTSVHALQADVDAIIDERSRMLPLQVEIESERGRVTQIIEELSKQEPVRNVRSALIGQGSFPVPAPPRSAKRTSGEQTSPAEKTRPGEKSNPDEKSTTAGKSSETRKTIPPRLSSAKRAEARERSSPSLALRDDAFDPFVNPVYEILQQQLAVSRSNLMALEREHIAIVTAIGPSGQTAKKIEELYRSKAQLDRLEMERDLARRAYVDVSNRYEQARIQVAARSAQMQVIDRAVPPTAPISPRPVRDAVFALAGGLMVASIAILLLAAMRTTVR
jgi:capsular polysaccharide biosynthesis protein